MSAAQPVYRTQKGVGLRITPLTIVPQDFVLKPVGKDFGTRWLTSVRLRRSQGQNVWDTARANAGELFASRLVIQMIRMLQPIDPPVLDWLQALKAMGVEIPKRQGDRNYLFADFCIFSGPADFRAYIRKVLELSAAPAWVLREVDRYLASKLFSTRPVGKDYVANYNADFALLAGR